MKLFATKLFYFVISFIILLLTVILLGYKLLNDDSYYKLPMQTHLIMLGHSHTECAYNDSLISGFANFGSAGESYFYTFLKVKKIIPNNKQIKTVFIEFENTQIDTVMNSWTWDLEHIHAQFPIYFPLLNFSEFKFLWTKNSNAILNCPPKFFINEIGFTIYSTYIIGKGIRSNTRFGGYRFLVRDKTDSLLLNMPKIKQKEISNYEISEINIYYLAEIIKLCKMNNIVVYLIRSPVHPNYSRLNNEPELKRIINSQFSNIEFLDFKDYPLKNSEFGDFGHLNYKGARIFSGFFNNILDSGILIKNNKQDFIDIEISKLNVPVN